MLKLGGLSSKFSAAPGDLGKVMPANSLKTATYWYLIGFSLISSPLFILGTHSPIDTQEMNTEFFHSSKVS